MIKLKHTPGPWELVEHSWNTSSIFKGDNHKIAGLNVLEYENESCEMQEEMDANGRLIACAPEMLDFIINCARITKICCPNDFKINAKLEIAIIEKATGQKIEDVLK